MGRRSEAGGIIEAAKNLPSGWVFLFLLGLTIFVRFPFFFVDVINWDESTYILRGQAILDRTNHQVEWGFRSFPYAIFLAVFGKTIASVRLAGAVCVWLVSVQTFLLGSRLWSRKVGFLASVLWIFMVSVIPGALATMSEPIALVPLLGAGILLLRRELSIRLAFLLGILLGLATLVRLNLAYMAILFGLLVLVRPTEKGWPTETGRMDLIKRGLVYGAGGLSVLVFSLYPYLMARRPLTDWVNYLSMAWIHSGSHFSFLQAAREHGSYILSAASGALEAASASDIWFAPISVLVWFGGLIGLVVALIPSRGVAEGDRKGRVLLVILFLGTCFSILRGGTAYDHYLIQVVPFLTLGVSSVLMLLDRVRFRHLSLSVVLVVSVFCLKGNAWSYRVLATDMIRSGTANRGPSFEIADYLRVENPGREPVYMMDSHVALWLLDMEPVSRSLVHPDNVVRDFWLRLFEGPDVTPEIEMNRILEKRPAFIVKPPVVRYLNEYPAVESILERALSRDYEMVAEVGGKEIHRRVVRHP